MIPRTVISLVLAFACGAVLQAAEENEKLVGLLEREVTGIVLPEAEAQRYCEARIPRMPKIESAESWTKEAGRLRGEILDKVVYFGEATRWRDANTKVEWLETIEGGPGYRIRKLRYEALPGLWIPALLYEPEKLSGKVPAIVNFHGHSHVGNPDGPKQLRCINLAKRGMLAISLGWVGTGQLRTDSYRHGRLGQLNMCGTSGLAPFYLTMKRGLDVLLSHENADPDRVAVTGLSGGGWQTIMLSSLDTRVKLSCPVAGYSSLITRIHHYKDMGDAEQVPSDLATLVDYTHLTAMLAPRPTLLTYNSKDACCFESGYALKPLLDAGMPAYRAFGAERSLRHHVNHDPGTHNYEQDNREAFYRILGDFFFAGSKDYNQKEIPSEDEIKGREELLVNLPENNEDFNTLAKKLSKNLPLRPELPKEKAAAEKWRETRRAELRELVKFKDYRVTAIKSGGERRDLMRVKDPSAGNEEADSIKATFWRLQMNEDWTVPAVELVRGKPKKTAILIADGGRKRAAADAEKLLDDGYRVLAVDLICIGECGSAGKYHAMMTSVGDRILGLQAGQLAAVARWAASDIADGPVTIVAAGPRSSNIALTTAALEQKAIGRLKLHGAMGTLKEVIEQNLHINQQPEVFCFGLLKAFDVKQLASLAAPMPIEFVNASERAKSELSGLAAWYELLGRQWQPLR
jgi:dienelactone hydrolase